MCCGLSGLLCVVCGGCSGMLRVVCGGCSGLLRVVCDGCSGMLSVVCDGCSGLLRVVCDGCSGLLCVMSEERLGMRYGISCRPGVEHGPTWPQSRGVIQSASGAERQRSGCGGRAGPKRSVSAARPTASHRRRAGGAERTRAGAH